MLNREGRQKGGKEGEREGGQKEEKEMVASERTNETVMGKISMTFKERIITQSWKE